MNDSLLWLLEWYHKQCDGDWEHGNGIKIGTMDNPGWYLKISLDETEIQDRNFQIVDVNRSENDWMYCSVEENLFKGFGGPFNLPEILQIFRKWVESCQEEELNDEKSS
jgi:hypothetical protein